MAKDDKQALQAAIEEIRKAVYEPKTTLPRVKRRVALILMKLREQTGEKPEPTIISTREKTSLFDVVRKPKRRR